MKIAPSIVGAWYSSSPDAWAKELHTSFEGGLSDHEAQQRLQREGFNELPEAPPPSLLKRFLSQFTSVIVWVLIGASIISGLLEDWLDAAAILAIVFLNGLIGFVQEFRAERSLAAPETPILEVLQAMKGEDVNQESGASREGRAARGHAHELVGGRFEFSYATACKFFN